MKKTIIITVSLTFMLLVLVGCISQRIAPYTVLNDGVDGKSEETLEEIKSNLLVINDQVRNVINSNSYFSDKEFSYVGKNELDDSWDGPLCIGSFDSKQVLIMETNYQVTSQFDFGDRRIATKKGSEIVILNSDGTYLDFCLSGTIDCLTKEECDACVDNYERYMAYYELKKQASQIS